MTPQEINGIYTDPDLNYAMKSYKLLRTWYRKNAYTDRCHYRVLVEASCDLEYADIAGEICKLIKGEYWLVDVLVKYYLITVLIPNTRTTFTC